MIGITKHQPVRNASLFEVRVIGAKKTSLRPFLFGKSLLLMVFVGATLTNGRFGLQRDSQLPQIR